MPDDYCLHRILEEFSQECRNYRCNWTNYEAYKVQTSNKQAFFKVWTWLCMCSTAQYLGLMLLSRCRLLMPLIPQICWNLTVTKSHLNNKGFGPDTIKASGIIYVGPIIGEFSTSLINQCFTEGTFLYALKKPIVEGRKSFIVMLNTNLHWHVILQTKKYIWQRKTETQEGQKSPKNIWIKQGDCDTFIYYDCERMSAGCLKQRTEHSHKWGQSTENIQK